MGSGPGTEHLEVWLCVRYGGEKRGSKCEIESEENPFWGLGPEEGHRGWILSSCYLAQTGAATLFLEQESVELENRSRTVQA